MLVKNLFKQTQSISQRQFASAGGAPKRVVVTGSAGNIAYALLFRIASGQFLGANSPVILTLLDIEPMESNLRGVQMELHDCAFPTLAQVNYTSDASKAFQDCDYAFLVGAKPRGPGMERSDLLKDNGKIFVGVGKAMNDHASRSCKTIVVGNPANTNSLIAANHAPGIPKENFTAMTRLDHNRALTQLALKTDSKVTDIKKLAIWGNHSPTMYPDINNTLIGGKEAKSLVDNKWITGDFIPTV